MNHNIKIGIDVVLLIGCLYWCYVVYFKNKKPKDNFKKLVGACFGDKDKAERLVYLELSSGNAFGRKAAIDLAISRLSRDRSST